MCHEGIQLELTEGIQMQKKIIIKGWYEII